ncbi:hypothetical protein H0H92_006657 [Tricholoma furcatifolium]|nr:hypothetical protein H0H92_006657 [Tricholoma furcatifolium]
MDNPQHYQPLSHALNPPQGNQATYTGMFSSKITTTSTRRSNREDDEEEEEDGDDEGMVEEQLGRQDQDAQSGPSSPQQKARGAVDPHNSQHILQEDPSQEKKRRPGRPRGSKNRKPRATSKQENVFHSTPAAVVPPQHPDVNAHNQQYYEFQWRVLNLCSEFYTAAEELVKATQPLVIAQCYQMGPGSKVDPLIMLNEAKRICDNLLSNPSQLVASPPPPMYPTAPTIYQALQPQPVASTSTAAASTAKSTTPAVISNPSTFVMSLPSAQPTYPQYSMYAAPGQYPTTPYYQYPYVTAGTAYYQHPQPQVTPAQPQPAAAQPVQTPQPEASTSAPITVSAANVITSGTGAGGNQGAWADEETERLKKLAEESRTQTGEIDWDRVVGQWGNGRTRHQILIKATSLGLKESSSRGVKRRRENDSDAASPSIPQTPAVGQTSSTASTIQTTIAPNPPVASPSQSQANSTPAASPALQNQQRPAPPKPPSNLPWPMPTVAVNTPSPVIAASSTAVVDQQQRPSYYRARPNTDVGKSTTPAAPTAHSHQAHPYMYQPNGSSSLGKQNGK